MSAESVRQTGYDLLLAGFQSNTGVYKTSNNTNFSILWMEKDEKARRNKWLLMSVGTNDNILHLLTQIICKAWNGFLNHELELYSSTCVDEQLLHNEIGNRVVTKLSQTIAEISDKDLVVYRWWGGLEDDLQKMRSYWISKKCLKPGIPVSVWLCRIFSNY